MSSVLLGMKANGILGCIPGTLLAEIKMWSSHSAQCLSAYPRSASVPLPTTQTNYRQTGDGPKEGCEDDQKAGQADLGENTEGIRSLHPGEEKALGDPNTIFWYLKGICKDKRSSLFTRSHMEEKRGNRHKLHCERFCLDIRQKDIFHGENN